MTNYENITSGTVSLNRMAKLLGSVSPCDYCKLAEVHKCASVEGACADGWLKWLRRKAAEE